MHKIRIYALLVAICLLLSACNFSALSPENTIPSTTEAEERSFAAQDLPGTSWCGQTEDARCTLTFGQRDVYVRSFTDGRLLSEEYTLSWDFQQESDGARILLSMYDSLCAVLTYDTATGNLLVLDFADSQIHIPEMQMIDMINTNYLLVLGTWECFQQEIFGEIRMMAAGECTIVISGSEDACVVSYTDSLEPHRSFANEKAELYLSEYYEGYYVRVAGEVILQDEFAGSYSFCLLEDGTLRLQMVELPDGEGDPIYISRWFRRAN